MIWLLCILVGVSAFFSAKRKATEPDDVKLLLHFAKNFVLQAVLSAVALLALWWLIETSWDAWGVFKETTNTPEFVRAALTVGACIFGMWFTAKTYWVLAGFDQD
jgi:hypothetical protein